MGDGGDEDLKEDELFADDNNEGVPPVEEDTGVPEQAFGEEVVARKSYQKRRPHFGSHPILGSLPNESLMTTASRTHPTGVGASGVLWEGVEDRSTPLLVRVPSR